MNENISNYLAGQKMAIIVIDMQNDFLLEGAPIQCEGGVEIVPHLQKLLSLARENNIPIIYTQEAHRAEKIDFGLELQGDEPEHCLEGTHGVEIYEPLSMRQGDYLIVKRRYSGFFATDLDILLKGLEVDLIILTGVATDVCVRATAQDGQQLNYRVVVPIECVAGTNADRHLAALENIRYLFGKVCTLDLLTQHIERQKAGG